MVRMPCARSLPSATCRGEEDNSDSDFNYRIILPVQLQRGAQNMQRLTLRGRGNKDKWED